MKVTVRLFAMFREFLPQHAVGFALHPEVDEHQTIRVLLQALHVPDDLPRIVLVNGRHASEDSSLTDGDIVSVFPPLIGGRASMRK